MGEPTEVVSNAEMSIWASFLQRLFDNAIRVRNAALSDRKPLRTGIVKPKLNTLSDRAYERLTKTWLPILQEGGISLETFLSKVPEINAEEEKRRIEESRPEDAFELPAQSGLFGGKEPA
jgi:hypothetical protein